MGYASTTIAFFGIELSDEEAKNIFEKYFNGEDEEFEYDEKDTLTDEISYVHHNTGPVYRERNIPQMLADGADSRVDNMAYSEDSQRHVLGIYLASRGYAYSDKIENYMKEVPAKAKENFEKYIRPILQKENIRKEPEILLINQTW